MYEHFGFGFYEWWAGLRRLTRVTIALAILAAGATLAWFMPNDGFLWLPIVITGGVLVVAA